ncbi:MAG: FtsX-like permease family protein, partial [Gammaproteobacteria bacterium]|nr:FtsX-like permease family protein [Gammaproteobacteria bacterium]
IGILISIISALFGSLFGAIKTIKLSPAVAMKFPTPESSHHLLLEKIPIFWEKISFRSKMILRTIFRNRFRSLVTILASLLATSLVFSSLSFVDSMDKMIGFSYEETQHQDYNLTLRDPLGADIMQQVKNIPGVARIETQLNIPAEIKYGAHIKRLGITGLPPHTTLFTPLDKAGKQISVEQNGLVITEILAKILNVQVGDYVLVKPLLGRRDIKKAPIMQVVPSYLGFAVYADQVWLSQMLGNSWLTTNILFKLKSPADKELFIKRINQFAPMINLVDSLTAKKLLIQTMNQFMTFSMFIMIAMAAIIAIGTIVNTAMISLNERERDVASLRVLGYTNTQVWHIFLGESAILNLVGILLGLGGGIYFSYLMSITYSTETFQIPFVINPIRLFESGIIMVVFVLISQLIIYHVIKKMDWFAILNTRE